MSGTSSKTLTRLCIGGVAAATIGSALVLPFANAAQAKTTATGDVITLTPASSTQVAGNCVTYTVKVTNASGTAVTPSAPLDLQVNSTTPGEAVGSCTNTSTPPATPVGGITAAPAGTTAGSGTYYSATPGPVVFDLSTAGTPNGSGATTTSTGVYTINIAARIAGSLTLQAFEDNDSSKTVTAGDITSNVSTETVDPINNTYTAPAGTNPATNAPSATALNGSNNNTVSALQAALATGSSSTTSSGTAGTPAGTGGTPAATPGTPGPATTYTVTALDANGAPVNNAFVEYYSVTSPETTAGGTSTAGSQTAPRYCTTGSATAGAATDNNGKVTCTVPGPGVTSSGTQTIRFFVDQNSNSASQPADALYEAPEPKTDVTRTIQSAPSAATTVSSLTPNGSTFPAGQSIAYTATVVDANGNPTTGTNVYFTKTGSGGGTNGQTQQVVTDNTGTAKFTVPMGAFNDQGPQNVTATLTAPAASAFTPSGAMPAGVDSTTCQPATGTTAPASCSKTATNQISNTPASPSTSPTAAPTSSASATPTATTSPSATPTASTSPSASPSTSPSATPSPSGSVRPPSGVQCTSPVGISINRAYIVPGLPVTVSLTAPAGADIEIQAYSRPNSTFQQVRHSTVGENGTISFDVTPGTNTRLFADCVSQTQSVSAQKVINVRTALGLSVVQNRGSRNFTFRGTILPRRAGQLITLYRVKSNGTRVLTAQVKTDDSGRYFIPRHFTGSGTFGFLTRTGQTLTNASGESTTAARSTGTDYLNSGRGTALQLRIR